MTPQELLNETINILLGENNIPLISDYYTNVLLREDSEDLCPIKITLVVDDDIYDLLEAASIDRNIIFKGKKAYLNVMISNTTGTGSKSQSKSKHGPRVKIDKYSIDNPSTNMKTIPDISINIPSTKDIENKDDPFDEIQGNIPKNISKDINLYKDFIIDHNEDLLNIFILDKVNDREKILDAYKSIAKDERVIIKKATDGTDGDEIYDFWIENNPNAKNKKALKASNPDGK